MVRASVVHTVGARSWTNGLRRTLRGAGMPERPPAVCTNRTKPGPTNGGSRRAEGGGDATPTRVGPSLTRAPPAGPNGSVPGRSITVFLADDNLIVREGVRALIGLEPDLQVVGVAEDYDGLLAGAEA